MADPYPSLPFTCCIFTLFTGKNKSGGEGKWLIHTSHPTSQNKQKKKMMNVGLGIGVGMVYLASLFLVAVALLYIYNQYTWR